MASLPVFDASDNWLDLASAAPNSSPSAVSTASTGEYNVFIDVGTIAGGGAHQRALWFKGTNDVCLGKVGDSKFCLRLLDGSSRSCGVAKHETRKFKVFEDFGYVQSAEFQGQCHPVLSTDRLSLDQLKVIKGKKLKGVEWEEVIPKINEGEFPRWMPVLRVDTLSTTPKLPHDELDLVSPRLASDLGGIFGEVPNLSFDESSQGDVSSSSDGVWKNKVDQRFAKIKLKWAAPFADIEANYAILVGDLQRLGNKVKEIASSVGVAKVLKHSPASNLWDGMIDMDNSLGDCVITQGIILDQLEEESKNVKEKVSEFDGLTTVISDVKGVQSAVFERLATIEQAVSIFHQRFTNIRPILMKVKNASSPTSVTATPQHSMGFQDDKLQEVLRRISKLEALANDQENWGAPSTEVGSSISVNALEALTRDHAAKIKNLENRVVGVGIQMGSMSFQTFEELKVWVSLNVPQGRFGLFVDGHSFLEFFTSTVHLDTEASAAAESHAEKAGYATYQETQVAGSFKNLFPAVFGKGGAATTDDAICLPAVSTGDKWNNGSTGLHHQLMRNMNDVSYEIDSSIKVVLQNYPEARQMATDCVTYSKRFVIDLITFMSTEYAVWQQRGLSKREAWMIVCQIVRRIFEDMQSSRISARSARDRKDIDFSTTTFIYATLKCHTIMAEYVKHQFHDHPAVSAVITRHLASNFIKPDAGGGNDKKLTALGNKIDSLDQRFSAYQAKNSKKPGAGEGK